VDHFRLREFIMQFSRRSKIAITAGAVAGFAATATGVAFAVWTVSGSGSGSAAATVANNLTVTAVTPSGPGASLYPGGPAGQVYLTVANPNPFAVTITGVTWGTPISTNPTSCASSNISVDASAPTTTSISIPANATAGTAYQINGVLDLAHTAPNGCQGVAFNVPVTVSATQQ
jgi:hypothetical protein